MEAGGSLVVHSALDSSLARWAQRREASRAEESHCVEEPAFKHKHGKCGRRATIGKYFVEGRCPSRRFGAKKWRCLFGDAAVEMVTSPL